MHKARDKRWVERQPAPSSTSLVLQRKKLLSEDGVSLQTLSPEPVKDLRDFMRSDDFSISSLMETGNMNYLREMSSLAPDNFDALDGLSDGLQSFESALSNIPTENPE